MIYSAYKKIQAGLHAYEIHMHSFLQDSIILQQHPFDVVCVLGTVFKVIV